MTGDLLDRLLEITRITTANTDEGMPNLYRIYPVVSGISVKDPTILPMQFGLTNRSTS